MNGASDQSERSEAKRCVASERSERCERTKVASDQVANALNRVTILVRDNLSQRLVYLKIGETIISAQKKQVTRGHNIVAEGWSGASNPQPHSNHTPNPPSAHSHTNNINCSIKNTCFLRFQLKRDNSSVTDGRTKPPIELRVRN